DAPAIRSYTLSDAPGGAHYRITVKREGRVSAWLHDHAQAGMTLDAQMPRGRFTFDVASPRPAVLVSAGRGLATSNVKRPRGICASSVMPACA
ncbi:hypothetical protein QM326_37560, partial [Burkholderia cenocepacia]|nr:hypothetical protein [Burkholderia cenocepacia]